MSHTSPSSKPSVSAVSAKTENEATGPFWFRTDNLFFNREKKVVPEVVQAFAAEVKAEENNLNGPSNDNSGPRQQVANPGPMQQEAEPGPSSGPVQSKNLKKGKGRQVKTTYLRTERFITKVSPGPIKEEADPGPSSSGKEQQRRPERRIARVQEATSISTSEHNYIQVRYLIQLSIFLLKRYNNLTSIKVFLFKVKLLLHNCIVD